MEEIRLLSKDDIDVRVAQTNIYNDNKGGKVVKVNLLLYKNARVDMKILDELFTPMGWKRSHKLIGDRLYCQVEVWDERKEEWICKEDVGVESNTEAEKGQASDSFKRACVNWGIGRELYTAPKVSVELNDKEYTIDQSGRVKVWASFNVKSITYETKTRTMTSLEIVDKYGKVRFSMGVKEEKTETPQTETPQQEAPQPPVTPIAEETYWKLIKAFANGVLCPSGMTAKEKFIELTHAGEEHIAKFDHDVENFKLANQPQKKQRRKPVNAETH